MGKFIKRAGWAALGVTLASAAALATWEPYFAEQPGPPPPDRAYRAEVIRDEWGVPHILGKTDADVAFGTAWAHAEDDFSTLQEVVAMTRGDMARLPGRMGLASILPITSSMPAVQPIAAMSSFPPMFARCWKPMPLASTAMLRGTAAKCGWRDCSR